jgi:hypothetical protein
MSFVDSRRSSSSSHWRLVGLALKARPDGTVLDGHHRIVLREREVGVDTLPREVVLRDVGE